MEGDEDSSACFTALASIANNEKERKERAKDKCRDIGKLWWEGVYNHKKDEGFKSKIRIYRETFSFMLNEIRDDTVMSPTNLKPFPTSPDRQLAMTLYRFATGCTHSTLSDLLGVSVSAANKFFNKVCRVLVTKLYDRFVFLTSADAEWEAEVCGFLGNYEFPCVGTWDGFHIYITSRVKNFFSFKKRYTMKNLGLVDCNKRFLYAAVGAAGSTHDARLLKELSIFHKILKGDVLPDRVISLGDFGYVPLVTVGDRALQKFSWLIKGYNENRRDKQQRYFNKRLCGVRVVTESASHYITYVLNRQILVNLNGN